MQKLLNLKCFNCNKIFQRDRNQLTIGDNVFCTFNCYRDYCKNKKTHIEKEKKKIRQEVYKRDNFKCTMCGRSKIRLDIHHIDGSNLYNSWADANNNKNNLITLCKSCHRKVHNAL